MIGVVGLQASGKTRVASILTDLGASRVRMGDIVWNEVKKRELEVNERNVAKIANELREKNGMGAVAKLCIPVIKEKGKKSEAVVVDGIRGIAEVEEFRKEFGKDFVLLSVEASEKTRYERIKGRKRRDDIETFEEFKKKDKREREWGIAEAIKEADYKIINEGSLSELKKKVSKIFKETVNENGN
ncbi:hypothetical protein AKJ49_01180 [candidate division MSBL1 archaeon SCGC-AAA382A03]|uniref:Dephospho-CoA kinase n=1 Tax=candidate division MSBL1 archaeon SCGC-AAA382A03 TaxID=1698278 RepID=A0A133VFS0_9EURY|nr:hypothetical protein AKJ49_01180 [candidate division MSBL1 archaeon SCGC-AAA382A03]